VKLTLDHAIIYLITKGEADVLNFETKQAEILALIRFAVAEKVSLIQIREKNLSARLLFQLTDKAADITRGTQTKLLVNDRADIALAAEADGVHLTTNSLATGVVRRSFPGNFIIGRSAHSLSEATQASTEGADFVVFGTVFPTPGKQQAVGALALSEVCEKLKPFPVVAIGGIDESNVRDVIAAGAAGFAAIRALNDFETMRSICREYRTSEYGER